MSIENIAISGAKWLWDQYGKDVINKAFTSFGKTWSKSKWLEAEKKYRARLIELYGTTRLLGYPKPINITEIFSDVFLLDKITAFKHYELSELQSRPLTREKLQITSQRHNILEIIQSEKRLYLLGKPGSGKTTLLKFLVLQSCTGKYNKTPVFISLREWADTEQDLISFTARQFDICGFPNAETFVNELFKRAQSLLLLDALDEVKEAQQKRIIREIEDFSKRYPDVQICLTCRIAATDYSFEGFTYSEVADFDDEQIKKFISKWYGNNKAQRAQIIYELAQEENQGLRELAQTPLLLALLCLAHDELGYFPKRKSDLYKETIDALLRRWDTSRLIERDSIYRDLTLMHKKKLLMHIAANYFEKGVYFVKKHDISKEIENYLSSLMVNKEPIDGEVVLRAIETQHGLLVERGRNIYSFLHLTFQEYFTALYLLENISDEKVASIFQKRLRDKRWDEILQIASNILAT